MQTYTKPALSFEQQIELLKNRGLNINDEERVKRHLANVSYYRLSAYMLPYKVMQPNGVVTDDFVDGTIWDDIWNLYKFDRKLRLLVFDAIERIEIALRTQIIYQLSHKYGPHWQNNNNLFKTTSNSKTGKIYSVYNDIQTHITEQLNSNRKVQFIDHYLKKYNNPQTPPSWMSIELLYFSELSKICQGLNTTQDIKDIASYFGVHNENIFCSWLHTINYVRNICAHHSRLWNHIFAIQPAKYKNPQSEKIWFSKKEVETIKSSKLYYFLCIILYMLQTINPDTKFRKHLKDLLDEYPNVNVHNMGFPSDWQDHPLWKNNFSK